MLVVTAGAAVAVVVLVPTVVLFFPAMGMNLAAAGTFIAALLGLALLPVVDLVHPVAGGQQGLDALRARRRGALPALAAGVATLVFAGAGLGADRFDAAHPEPTHLMYALDADTGRAQWLSESATSADWTGQYVSGEPAPVTATLPFFGDKELLAGPAQPAALAAPDAVKTSDSIAGGLRTVKLRLTPRRPDRLVSLHVGRETVVTAATAGGRTVPTDQVAGDTWGFGFVFHAPPAEGIDVTLTVRTTGPLTLRVMDASDGLAGLPGFVPRPAGVGVVGSHSSEMLAVARTYRI